MNRTDLFLFTYLFLDLVPYDLHVREDVPWAVRRSLRRRGDYDLNVDRDAYIRDLYGPDQKAGYGVPDPSISPSGNGSLGLS